MRAEGVVFGRFSILGNIDLTQLVPREHLAVALARHPEYEAIFAAGRQRGIQQVAREARGFRDLPVAPPIRTSEGAILEAARPSRRSLPVYDRGLDRRVCSTCPAPCCQVLWAGLTADEAASGKWEVDGPYENGAFYLKRVFGRCVYLDENNRCTTYQDRPAVCVDYRCDDDRHPDDRISRWLLRNT